MTTPFDLAKEAVEAWLDGQGAAFVTRVSGGGSSAVAPSWALALNHPKLPGGGARIVLPRDFPASPAEVHLDSALCLVLPHVEETGKVCLGVNAAAHDYDEPAVAVGRVLSAFGEFLERCRDDLWVADELQRECWAYWVRYCDAAARRSSGRQSTRRMAVALNGQTGCCERKVAGYLEKSSAKGVRVVVACQGADEADSLAHRHGLDGGQLVHGRALFVSLPITQDWRPGAWPTSFNELDRAVAVATEENVSLHAWVEALPDRRGMLSYVVLVRGVFAYAYQVLPPRIPHLTPVTITPVQTTRIDSSWALTRGYEAERFAERQRKRVLLLGCGSLGSPVAELLVRSGVGQLVLVDPEVFLPENCARHILGLSAVHAFKATRLADRLRREVPGAEVVGVTESASGWIGKAADFGSFDLVLDCTGESAVRAMLARYRNVAFCGVPIVHAWLEPFCAAAHVVLLGVDDVWPVDDPADSKVNVAEWPNTTRVDLPACGAGFHPYGAADVMQAAGFSVERLLSVLDGIVGGSQIWSWVRTTAYFDSLPVVAAPRSVVPSGSSRHDSTMLTRDFGQVIYGPA